MKRLAFVLLFIGLLSIGTFVHADTRGDYESLGQLDEHQGGVILNIGSGTTTRPECDSSMAGSLWYTNNNGGLADSFEGCYGLGSSVYTWLSTVSKGISQYFLSGVSKPSVKMYTSTATVAGGNAVFNVTDDGTSGGNAVFANVYTDSIQPDVFDATNIYRFGSPTVSGNKKTITVPVTKYTQTTLLGITVLTIAANANGTVVKMTAQGD